MVERVQMPITVPVATTGAGEHRPAGSAARGLAATSFQSALRECLGREPEVSFSEHAASRLQQRKYLSRLSGPLLDRVDVRVTLERPTMADLAFGAGQSESTRSVLERVATARDRSRTRLSGTPWETNAHVPGSVLRNSWPLPADVEAPLLRAVADGRLSARGLDRVLRVAWTCADLAGRTRPTGEDVGGALLLRDGGAAWAA